MSTQEEKNLPDFLVEMRELRVRLEGLLPDYLVALHRVCQMPQEFQRRFLVSQVETIVLQARTDYKNYNLQAVKVILMGKMTEAVANFALQAIGKQPMAPVTPLQTCLSIHPRGRIEPALFTGSPEQKEVILLSLEEFEAITKRLVDGIMQGEIRPESEYDLPGLIYELASNLPATFPRENH